MSSEEMETFAKECATKAMERFSRYNNRSRDIRVKMDQRFGPNWSCVVGDYKNMGWDVRGMDKFFRFDIDGVVFLVFKA